jgi:hypothetical protein
MIAPVCKAEFLSMLKDTVHFSLPQGYIPTEQTLTTFLYQLLVYKERMFRAFEFILLYDGSDACLPACDSKPQGLLKLISDEVPHRFIELILQSDPPGSKYSNIYKFFTRVAIYTKRCETLRERPSFSEPHSEDRNSKRHSEMLWHLPVLHLNQHPVMTRKLLPSQRKPPSLSHPYFSASGRLELPEQ